MSSPILNLSRPDPWRNSAHPGARGARVKRVSGRRIAVGLTVTMTIMLAMLTVTIVTTTVGTLWPAAAATPGSSPTDTRPVNLSTPVNLSNGTPHPSAVVLVGDARFEVLSPTLIRLEYSPSRNFENSPTVNAMDRRLPVPRYTVTRSNGWVSLRTDRALLRYKIGSGPFTAANTSLQLSVDGHPTTVNPTWEWECTFGQVCQAGAASLGGGASLGQQFNGYQSTAGYAGDFLTSGASVTWHVLGATAGPAQLAIRYTNLPSPPVTPETSQFELEVDGQMSQLLSAIPTTAAEPWATLTAAATLVAGTNTVRLISMTPDSFDLGVDSLSIGPAGAALPALPQTGPLGGWIRGFDTDTYNENPTCGPGQSGATCQAGIEPLNTDGLLDTAGWRLVDDTDTALWAGNGWVKPRPTGGDIEDGYLFAYGHNYTGALHTLAQLTGPAPLPVRNVFGVWYSDYTPYSSKTIEQTLFPAFAANDVPLNALSLDTDWKAPNDWNGWEWNTQLFPDPTSFLQGAKQRGIDVTLNIHSSIDDNDPKLPEAQRIAGHRLASSTCTAGPCKVWDWSSASQAESNFTLQQSFQKQGVSFWWLDWCCDDSIVSMAGVTPDAWIDHLYAQDMNNLGQRGFVLARIGGSNADPEEVYPAGPWSDHTSTVAFTGDAWGTWNTLAAEAALPPAEASVGEPYVSSDIGSYLGPPPTQSGADPPDLYDRWVQLGTFQPILRLHSNNEDRLPWQYPQPVQAITESFLRLREALLPYTYTLAAESHRSGLPMTRPLYLDYPDQPSAYLHPTEYLYGPDMLVAPVTSPGTVVASTVWFPPGRWIDFFTGATFTGPSSATLDEPLGRMPVFVRAGGIIAEQPSTAGAEHPASGSLTVTAYAGASGSFNLYDDAGTGLGYTKGQSTDTLVTTSTSAPSGGTPSARVTIAATRGHFPGESADVTYRVTLADLTRPTSVTLNGRRLPATTGSRGGSSWSYDATSDTVSVITGSDSRGSTQTVVARGTTTVARAEPPVGT